MNSASSFRRDVLAFAASCLQQDKKISPTITSSETPEPVPVRASDKTFNDFSHAIAEHKQFECVSCHRREGAVARDGICRTRILRRLSSQPVHRRASRRCAAICHDDLKQVPPTMNEFPQKFVEGFNMKFDHAAHERGEGRPPQGLCRVSRRAPGRARRSQRVTAHMRPATPATRPRARSARAARATS